MAIYLDYNASTPVNSDVLDYMIEVYKSCYGNPSSRTHLFGIRASQILESSREKIASILGVSKHEVVFTSGATESDNMVIQGLAEYGLSQRQHHIISTSIEHKAVLEPLRYLGSRGFDVELVDPDVSGRIDPDAVLSRMRPDTLLVSVMHVNNETGVVQPIDVIAQQVAKTNAYFHTDAAQSFGKLVPELANIKYDFLSISGHKVYGPQGIGALVIKSRGRRRPPLKPIIYGGGHEGGLRSGTTPVALVAGLGKIIDIAAENWRDWFESMESTKKIVLREVGKCGGVINGDLSQSVPWCVNVSFQGVDSEALMMVLKDIVAVSNGSACTSKEYIPSHVLTAMGLSTTRIESAIRMSWGPFIHLESLAQLVQTINQLRGNSSK